MLLGQRLVLRDTTVLRIPHAVLHCTKAFLLAFAIDIGHARQWKQANTLFGADEVRHTGIDKIRDQASLRTDLRVDSQTVGLYEAAHSSLDRFRAAIVGYATPVQIGPVVRILDCTP